MVSTIVVLLSFLECFHQSSGWLLQIAKWWWFEFTDWNGRNIEKIRVRLDWNGANKGTRMRRRLPKNKKILRAKIVDEFGPIEDWDLSGVTNMRNVFYGVKSKYFQSFNADISKWKVGAVTHMDNSKCSLNFIKYKHTLQLIVFLLLTFALLLCVAFTHAKSFNGDISKWDTSSVTTMYASKWKHIVKLLLLGSRKMYAIQTHIFLVLCFYRFLLLTLLLPFFSCVVFNGALKFNGDLSKWDTRNVLSMPHST